MQDVVDDPSNTVVDLLSQWSQDTEPIDQQYGRARNPGAHAPSYSSYPSNPSYSQFSGSAGTFQGNLGAFQSANSSYNNNSSGLMGNATSFVSNNVTNFSDPMGQRQYDFGRTNYPVNDFSSPQINSTPMMNNSQRPTETYNLSNAVSRNAGGGFYDQFAMATVSDAGRGFCGTRGGGDIQQHGSMLGMEQGASSSGMYGGDLQSSHQQHGLMGIMGLPGGAGGGGGGSGGCIVGAGGGGIGAGSMGMDSHSMSGYHQGGAMRSDGGQYGGGVMAAISVSAPQAPSGRANQVHMKPDPGAAFPAQQVALGSRLPRD